MQRYLQVETVILERNDPEAWKTRPLIWLFGVRRAGKTVLSRSISGAA